MLGAFPSRHSLEVRGRFTPGESAIMNVRVWLRGLGLGRYEEKFQDNKIDVDVLLYLTDGDLQEIGVPIGDRRRLLRAIAELGAPSSPMGEAEPNSTLPARSVAQVPS